MANIFMVWFILLKIRAERPIITSDRSLKANSWPDLPLNRFLRTGSWNIWYI
jgi:hypothetical protein